MKTLLFALIGFALALIAKAAGRFAATVRKVDPHGSRWTITVHLRRIARLLGAAGISALVVLGVFLAPAGWAWLAVGIGLVALVAGNLSLGALAGTSESLGVFLGRASRARSLDNQIAMKRRLRDTLRRFFVVLVVASSAGVASAQVLPEVSCALGVDDSKSRNTVSFRAAAALVPTFTLEYAQNLGCTKLMVLRIGGEPRFAERTWLSVPESPEATDCKAAEPEPLPLEAAMFGWSRGLALGRKQAAVSDCERASDAKRPIYAQKRAAFLRELEAALARPGSLTTSKVTPAIRYIAGGGEFRGVIALSDFVDNPKVEAATVTVPPGVSIVLVAVEPDPKYGTTEKILSRLSAWARIPGVRVVTAPELRSGPTALSLGRR